MAARGSILGEIGDMHEAASNEFNEICSSHQDYIWNILHETPESIDRTRHKRRLKRGGVFLVDTAPGSAEGDEKNGANGQIRTDDLLITNQLLYP